TRRLRLDHRGVRRDIEEPADEAIDPGGERGHGGAPEVATVGPSPGAAKQPSPLARVGRHLLAPAGAFSYRPGRHRRLAGATTAAPSTSPSAWARGGSATTP